MTGRDEFQWDLREIHQKILAMLKDRKLGIKAREELSGIAADVLKLSQRSPDCAEYRGGGERIGAVLDRLVRFLMGRKP